MTKIKVVKKNGKIAKVTCDGHTNYGVSGEDIVCSGLSCIIQTAVLGLLVKVGIDVKLKRNEEKGFLSFEIPDVDENTRHDIDIILDTMMLGIGDLQQGFSDFIELEVEE